MDDPTNGSVLQYPADKGQGPGIMHQPADNAFDRFILGMGVTPEEAGRRVAGLLALAGAPKTVRDYEATVGGNTDGSGNCQILLFQVPEGYTARLTRVVVEVSGTTANAPYTNASAWLGLFELGQGTQAQPTAAALAATVGALRDFLPTAASGPLLPALITDGSHASYDYRPGRTIWFGLFSGPASKQVAVTIKALLTPRT